MPLVYLKINQVCIRNKNYVCIFEINNAVCDEFNNVIQISFNNINQKKNYYTVVDVSIHYKATNYLFNIFSLCCNAMQHACKHVVQT